MPKEVSRKLPKSGSLEEREKVEEVWVRQETCLSRDLVLHLNAETPETKEGRKAKRTRRSVEREKYV